MFYQNIGLLIMRVSRSVEGNLCKPCMHKTFWQFTLITLFFGWWGIISFFVTPLCLVCNSIVYFASLGGFSDTEGTATSGPQKGLPACAYCAHVDPDLPRRGYCMKCQNDV